MSTRHPLPDPEESFMIDHLELKTRNLAASLRFYTDTLTPLGYKLTVDGAAKGFGDGLSLDLFLLEGDPSANVHFAFRATDRATVDRVYALGREAGHRTDREPALAPHIHAHYYAAYLRDPDDRLVEFVCHKPE
jgi:catechol 2,3-dioxygenase-like lactoylglutathione lyase family enzyme